MVNFVMDETYLAFLVIMGSKFQLFPIFQSIALRLTCTMT